MSEFTVGMRRSIRRLRDSTSLLINVHLLRHRTRHGNRDLGRVFIVVVLAGIRYERVVLPGAAAVDTVVLGLRTVLSRPVGLAVAQFVSSVMTRRLDYVLLQSPRNNMGVKFMSLMKVLKRLNRVALLHVPSYVLRPLVPGRGTLELRLAVCLGTGRLLRWLPADDEAGLLHLLQVCVPL